MKYKIKRKKKAFKTSYIFIIFLIFLISISISYSIHSTRLVIYGRVKGVQDEFKVMYLYMDNSESFPSTIKYMETYSYTFANQPKIESITMGGNQLILNTDYTYTNGTLTIQNATGDIVIEGQREKVNVTFDIDGKTEVVSVVNGETVNKPSPNPTKEKNGFLGWVDENGNFFDFTTLITKDITLYAKWIEGKVAEINGKYYNTLQDAVKDVPTNNTQTTVRLLANVSEKITVAQNKNINFDFQDYTISITSGTVITNNGTITITNGTLTSSSTDAATINNNQTGNLTISGGKILMTNSNGKQALYNDKGTVLITGSAFLSSASSAKNNNKRATVQNQANSTLTINGGTIISTGFQGVNNAGTMTIGTEDGNPNINSLLIQAATDGINSTTNFSFYDGIVKGKTSAISNVTKITEKETEYKPTQSEEIIEGEHYKVIYLSTSDTINFDANGGTTNETVRHVERGKPIGKLPEPTKNGHFFDGWFTEIEGGEEISSTTIVTGNVTYYAHWTKFSLAKIGEIEYETLQEAVDAVPEDNTETTIKLLNNTSEAITVKAKQNIKFDLQNYTISNANDKVVIDNSGKVTIFNGNLTSNKSTIIDNQSGATLIVKGGKFTATGPKQAIYNFGGGTVEISGNVYISSSATGTPTNETLERATVQNLQGGEMKITGGTIVGLKQQAISNSGTLDLGIKDGTIDTTKTVIIGNTCGLKNNGTINFYDGIIKGIEGAISGEITQQEDNSQIKEATEEIDGKTYLTKCLELIP